MSVATWMGAQFATGGGGGAAPAVPLISIDADGWQANYDGTPPSTLLNTAFTATGIPGYDSNGSAVTNRTWPVLITKRLRDAGLTSLQATKVGLSDKLPAGAVVAGVTNNSTAVSPKPISNWVCQFNKVIGNSDRIVDLVAFHYYGIACVEVTMSDGVTTLTQKTSTMADISRTGDAKTVYGYRVTFPAASVATLNDGQITYNAKVYPTIGVAASIMDSAAYVANGFPVWKFAPRYDVKDVTRAATPFYAYLSTTGNDGTGIWSATAATAAASPFLTYAGALAAAKLTAITAGTVIPSSHIDGCEIRVGAGTFAFGQPPASVGCKGGQLIITRDPGASRATAIIQHNAGAAISLRIGSAGTVYTNCYGPILFKDLTFSRTVTFFMSNTAPRQILEFEDVIIANTASGSWVNTPVDIAYWGSCSATSGISPNTFKITTGGGGFLITRGGNWTMGGNDMAGYNPIGGQYTNVGQFAVGSGGLDNMTACFNVCNGDAGTTFSIASSSNVVGAAFVGNVSEWTTTTTNPAMRASADAEIGNVTHMLELNCTYAGANDCGRHNDKYVDNNAPAGSPIRVHQWLRSENNIKVQDNTKHDLFPPASAVRIGGWESLLGVGYRSNYIQFRDAGGGSNIREWSDPATTTSNSNTSTLGFDPRFKNPQHTTLGAPYTAGAGFGDYRLMRISEGNPFDSPCLTGAVREWLPGFGTVIGAYP